MNHSPRQNYRDNRFRGNSRGYSRQDDRGKYKNERYNNYNRDRSRPRERNFTRNYNNSRDRCSSSSRLRSGSIEIEYDVMHVENMTISQETVPIPERREICYNCKKC